MIKFIENYFTCLSYHGLVPKKKNFKSQTKTKNK